MIFKTLKFKILSILLTLLTLGVTSLYYISNTELKKSIDEFQSLYYIEKIDTIIKQINEKYEKLQKTNMPLEYEESFKKGTIASLKEIYFNDTNKEVFLFIVNKNRSLLLHPNVNEKNRKNYESNDIMQKVVSMKEGSFEFEFKKENRWMIFKHYKEWDWIVGFVLPSQTKYKALEKFRNNFFIGFLIFLILTSFLVVIAIRHFISPIENLTSASKKIASGDLKSDIKINGSYELTELSKSFSIMRNKIKNNLEELEKTNEVLEQKVDDRTHELEKTIFNLKQMQKQLVESEKIASLGSLVAGVAHEINTPIGIGVTGATHFLTINKEILDKYDNDDLSKEEFENFIKVSYELATVINTNLVKAADLIRSFKKVAIDRASEEKRKFNFKDYINEILVSLQNLTKKTRHQFVIECPQDLDIDSYPGLFSQVITNFIMNSFIHAFKDKKVGKIQITVKEENNVLLFNYQDNGCGISEEDLAKIYEPFFTTNRKEGGSGLGLNIVHNIVVSQLKGTIDVNSKLGEGVEFFVKIPL